MGNQRGAVHTVVPSGKAARMIHHELYVMRPEEMFDGAGFGVAGHSDGDGYGHAEFFPEWPGDGDGWGGWGNAYGDVPGDGSGSGCWDDCE